MKTQYKILLPEQNVTGDIHDTVLFKACHKFLDLMGFKDIIDSSKIHSVDGIMTYITQLLIHEVSKGDLHVAERNDTGNRFESGTITKQMITNNTGFPRFITSRFIHSFTVAYMNAIETNDELKDVIFKIKTPNDDTGKITQLYMKYPEPIKSSNDIKGFQNILYNVYTSSKDNKLKKITTRDNIINDAISKVYDNITRLDVTSSPIETSVVSDTVSRGKTISKDEYADIIKESSSSPGDTLIKIFQQYFGLEFVDTADTQFKFTKPVNDNMITLAYQTNRGQITSLYPDMILPNEINDPVVYTSEEYGKLVASYGEAPEQGDLNMIKDELLEISPKQGEEGNIQKDIKSIPKYFTPVKPFNKLSMKTFVFMSGSSKRNGHPYEFITA